MTVGLSFEKIALLLLLAMFVVGPDRLPIYASLVARGAIGLRSFVSAAKTRVEEELGTEFTEADWKRLDPRQYDPRRIIAQALLVEPEGKRCATPDPMPVHTDGGVVEDPAGMS